MSEIPPMVDFGVLITKVRHKLKSYQAMSRQLMLCYAVDISGNGLYRLTTREGVMPKFCVGAGLVNLYRKLYPETPLPMVSR